MMRGAMNIAVSGLLAILLAAGLSACGRKGPLEKPDSSITAIDNGQTDQKQEERKPDRPFILDGLI